ncbi:TetR family transcriptional regulator [Enterobacteriaceae bacterium C23F]
MTQSPRLTPRISTRKEPKQIRSASVVAAILQAATQVLAREGANRFTTARVAERAGISIGSLYQYFPNKAAILFRLQQEEWQQTSAILQQTLEDEELPLLDRLRQLVHLFVRSECEEAGMRIALSDAAPLYRDAPETHEARAGNETFFQAFVAECLPGTPEADRQQTAELLMETLSAVGHAFSQHPRTGEEIERRASALAEMLCSYLQSLQQQEKTF